MQVAAVAAAVVAAVEGPSQGAEEVAAQVQAVVVEGVRRIDCCRTAVLTEESMVVVVSYRRLHNAVGYMWPAAEATAAYADPGDTHLLCGSVRTRVSGSHQMAST